MGKMRENSSDINLERRLETWADAQSGISPELRTKIGSLLTPSLTSVKPIPSQSRLLLSFLVVFAVCGAVLIAILDKAGFRLMTASQMGWMVAILTGGGILFSLTLASQMVPGSRRGIPLWGVIALSGAGVIAGVALLFPWQVPAAFVADGWPCAVLEVTIAIPSTLVFWSLARRGALFASAGLGVTLTGLAVFLALMPLQFQCMFPQSPHLLVWHGGTAAVLIALGAAAGKSRLRRVR